MNDKERIEYFMAEIARLSNQVIDLQNERDALAAHNSELVSACKLAIDMFVANECNVPNTIETLQDAIDENPQQRLAEIRAEAGLAGYFRGTDDAWKDLTGGNSPEQMTAQRAIKYANEVRQGGE